MQGILQKWTNMFSGWQPRWFVLENGVLSYYKSQEEVSMGSKGSLKMAVCDVNVHPHDPTRLDLVIPGEQHFYIKASTPQERQQWLVALGTAKACLNNGTTPLASGEMSPEIVRTKKSELRLYCDLLMQQVHDVRGAIEGPDAPNLQKLDEATSLLRATCETFISTLEGCMQLANAHAAIDRSHTTHISVTPTRQPTSKPVLSRTMSAESRRHITPTVHLATLPRSQSASEDSGPPTLVETNVHKENQSPVSNCSVDTAFNNTTTAQSARINNCLSTPTSHHLPTAMPRVLEAAEVDSESIGVVSDDSRSLDQDIFEDAMEPSSELPNINIHIDTFFNTLSTTFRDIVLQEDSFIPTEVFLEACRCLMGLFDKLNSTAFAPVKMDVSGNIRKIHQKYITDPPAFVFLQRIILYEVTNKQHASSNSATSALLWLKRSLEFLLEFLDLLSSTHDDLATLTTEAYSKTLKPYHSWVVRGVFALAVKAIPYREDFIQSLFIDVENVPHPHHHVSSLMNDICDYVVAMRATVTVLRDFYIMHDLDLDDQV